jgi:hypothetical protein
MRRLDKIVLRDDPDVNWDEGMEFRLTYQGVILAERGGARGARAEHKHEIRRALHPQLKRLWDLSPFLGVKKPSPKVGGLIFGQQNERYTVDSLSARFARFGYNFVPLVTRDLELLCSIEVLFLRFGEPGQVLTSGDIDNRLKTLFDALSMPRDLSQVGKYTVPAADETPFFCLLEDDSLITRAAVETDMLLQPVSDPQNSNDARVIITVRLKPGRVYENNIAFG